MLQDFFASGRRVATLPIRVQFSLVFMATKPHFRICCSPQKSFPAISVPIKISMGVWLLSLILYSSKNETKNFQQDNASIPVSNSSKPWFQRENIVLLPWSLNPIENVWGSLVREVYKCTS